MTGVSEIKVYIFREDDGLDRAERLLRAAEMYCSAEAGNFFGGQRDSSVAREMFQVEKTPLGKPYFPKMKELHFSISHSGDYWVCAFAPEEVGVDIQQHALNRGETRQEAMVRFGKMSRRFFHPLEADYVETESFYRFFGVWTARESYVKYTGQGIDASFSEHCVIPEKKQLWPELTPQLSMKQGDGVSWQAQGVWFWQRMHEENYTLCVCSGEKMSCSVKLCYEDR